MSWLHLTAALPTPTVLRPISWSAWTFIDSVWYISFIRFVNLFYVYSFISKAHKCKGQGQHDQPNTLVQGLFTLPYQVLKGESELSLLSYLTWSCVGLDTTDVSITLIGVHTFKNEGEGVGFLEGLEQSSTRS